MRTLICEWLLDQGYAVQGLSVRSLPAQRARADLVIVDVPYFRARGADTVRAVRARYPNAALIGLSTQLGRSLRSDSGAARGLGLSRLVAKPCTREELLDAVADAIGAAG